LTTQARSIPAGLPRGKPSEGSGLITLTVLTVVTASASLAMMGKLDATFATIIAILAMGAGILGAASPRIILTLLFSTSPLLWALGDANLFESDKVHLNLPMIVGFVILVSFSHLLLVKYSDVGIETTRKLVLGMGLACFPAIFFAQDISTGAGIYLRVMCPYVAMFATLKHIRNKKDVVYFARCMVTALLAVAAILVIGYFRSELWVDLGGYTRLTALYFPPQGFGMFLSVMVLVVMLNYLLSNNKGYLLLLGFPLILLFYTYVRTAWVGGAVLLALFVIHITTPFQRKLLLCLVVLFPLFYYPIYRGILRYDTSVDSPEVADKIFSGRLAVDAIAIETYLDAPLKNKIFGIGYLRAGEATELVYGEEFLIHDDYLGYLIEAGVLASAIYLAILIWLLKRSHQGKLLAKNRSSYESCFAASILIVAVMIMGIPGAFYTQVLSNLYIYGIMGLMLSQVSTPQAS
jgi:O-Antigen ligase